MRVARPKPPTRLHVYLNGLYPRESCYVSDDIGTANGGFRKGFRTHAAMRDWLARQGYDYNQEGFSHE